MGDGGGGAVTSECYAVGPESPVATRVRPGASLTLHCEDASGGQIREGCREKDLDVTRLFPVTGAVAVDDVEPGDAVGIEILGIAPLRKTGTIWTRTGLGVLEEVSFHARDVNLEKRTLEWLDDRVEVPSALHVGTAGVVPRDPCLGRDVGAHGGNIDFKRFGIGATLWLAAQMPGGNVFVGDVHAAMGDGEVCGTGVEIASAVDVRLLAVREWAPRLPTVTTTTGAWLIGIGPSVEEGLKQAVREAVRLVATRRQCSLDDAYLAVSSLLVVDLCQVVNSSASVAVTLSGGLGELLGPDPEEK